MPSAAEIAAFFANKVGPFLAAIASTLPGLLTSNVSDFQAAVQAILKLLGDFQSDVSALVAAAK